MFIHSFLRVPREVSSRLYCQQFWPDLPWLCMCGRKQKRKKAAEIPEEKKKKRKAGQDSNLLLDFIHILKRKWGGNNRFSNPSFQTMELNL